MQPKKRWLPDNSKLSRTSHDVPSFTVDRSTEAVHYNILIKQLVRIILYIRINSSTGLLLIMYDHCCYTYMPKSCLGTHPPTASVAYDHELVAI